MEANFQSDLNWIHQQVDKIKDPKFLLVVKNLFEYRQEKSNDFPYQDDDYIEELGCTVGEYNKEIDEAISEVKKGNYVSHEDVMKESKTWLKRK